MHIRRRLLVSRRSLALCPVAGPLLALGLTACYEIPPRVPEAPENASPPPSAYAQAPYHPASLFFQRAFGRRGADQTLVPRDPARLLPFPEPWSAIDCVEVLSILQMLAPESLSHPVDRAVLRSDALALATMLRAREQTLDGQAICDEVLVELLRVALAPPRADYLPRTRR